MDPGNCVFVHHYCFSCVRSDSIAFQRITLYRLPGNKFNLVVGFPWEESIGLEIRLEQKDGAVIEKWIVPMSQKTFSGVRPWIDVGKKFIAKIMEGK
jgi:hypothetical protein